VKGKAVFVTGCDSGFGHALAKHLHKLGFTVFAGCLFKDNGGEGAKELEEFHSDRMKVVQLDVCSEEQVNQAVEYIKDNLEDSERGLWAVVNNAGVSTFGEVEFTSIDTYKQVSEVNLWGTIRVTKAVLPLIRRAKGGRSKPDSDGCLENSLDDGGVEQAQQLLEQVENPELSRKYSLCWAFFQIDGHILHHLISSYCTPLVECRAEVHKQDPCVHPWGVEVLQDVVLSHANCIVQRPVCPVDKL
ncbi:D-beta-hydroxybutyrate dehydrogenase, mitochondrial-like, partial [Plectropomus leopardus]|uniref:D-beta-hydroxybutyrate dehydrogenase, mitochondrial-like n=1 Tax=Plectropomus leopardus TaxID=160734 RepID=UPI001C4C424A